MSYVRLGDPLIRLYHKAVLGAGVSLIDIAGRIGAIASKAAYESDEEGESWTTTYRAGVS